MDLLAIAAQLFGVPTEQVDAVQEFFNFSQRKQQYVDQFSLQKKQLREVLKLVIHDLLELPEDFKQFFIDGVDFALWRTDDDSVKHVVKVFRNATHVFETLPAIHDNPQLANCGLPLLQKIRDIDYGVFVGKDWSEVEFAKAIQRGDRTEEQHIEMIAKIEVSWRKTRLEYKGA